MDVIRAILDGIAIAAIFNGVVAAKSFGILESFLDGIYSVEHIELRGFFAAGLFAVSR